MRSRFLFLLLIINTLIVLRGEAHTPSLSFIENKGQWGTDILYQTSATGAGSVFVVRDGLVYNFAHKDDWEKLAHQHDGNFNVDVRFHAYKVKFLNANNDVKASGDRKLSTYYNYFIGNDSRKWASRVGLFGQVAVDNIYDGIAINLYREGESTALKYDFIVAAHADPSRIRLQFDGIVPVLDEKGALVINTSVNTVVEDAPETYQVIDGRKVIVASRYKLDKNILSFEFPQGYNTDYDLVIDPRVVFATYSGATTNGSIAYSHSSTCDFSENMFAVAEGFNIGWPTTLGAFQTNYAQGGSDVVINKFNTLGTGLLYSTYYGGATGQDRPYTSRANHNNELIIGGMTNSSDVPVTTNGQKTTKTGNTELFLARFSEDGTQLLGGTYLGNTGNTAYFHSFPSTGMTNYSSAQLVPALEVNFDASNNIWVVTNANTQAGIPTTSNAFQPQKANGYDVVILKYTSDLSQIMYGSFLGGGGDDVPHGIELLSNGHPVIVGSTTSSDFPIAGSNVYDNSYEGTMAGFAVVLDPVTGQLTRSTYISTTGADMCSRVDVDRYDNIFILGRNSGAAFPVSSGAYTNIANPATSTDLKMFVMKMDAQLSVNQTSTAFSGSQMTPTAFIVDECSNIYFTTMNGGAGLPLTLDAFQTRTDDLWFGALSGDMSELIFGTYYGDPNVGDHCHTGTNRFDKQGQIYHSVCVYSDAWPTTSGSYSPRKLSTSYDVISFKFDFEKTGVFADIQPDRNLNPIDSGCAPHTVAFQGRSIQARSFFWDFDDGTTSTVQNPSHTFTQAGDYNVMFVAINDSLCITHDTAYLLVRVYDVAVPQLRVVDTNLCVAVDSILITVDVLNPSSGVPGNVFSWQAGGGGAIHGDNNTQSVWIRPAGTFTVTVLDSVAGVCTRSATATVNVNMRPRILEILTPDTAVCVGDIVPIRAIGSDGYTYRWQPTIGLNDSTLLEPQITVNRSQLYMVTASYPYCIDTSDMINITMHEYPVVEVTAPSEACEGSEVRLRSDVSPYRNDYIYTWSNTRSAILPATNVPNVSFLADTVDRMYYLKVETPIGCSDSVSKFIVFHAKGNGDAISGAEYCAPGSAQLWAMNGASYRWDPAYGLDDPTSATPVTNVSTNTNYKVYITDDNNCVDTLEVAVQVHPRAVLSLPKEITVYPGEGYQAAPETNALYFEWFPPSGLSNPDISDPYILPAVRTRYVVTARTENGCEVTDSMDVLVGDPEIGMPNAYNPSNPEARLFKPVVRGGWDLKSFRIYNRWGTLIYESSDIKSGWDGTFNSTAQPFGVYVWIIEAVNANGETYQQTGNVTMIR